MMIQRSRQKAKQVTSLKRFWMSRGTILTRTLTGIPILKT